MGIHALGFIMVGEIWAKHCLELVLDEVIVEVFMLDQGYSEFINKVCKGAVTTICTVFSLSVVFTEDHLIVIWVVKVLCVVVGH